MRRWALRFALAAPMVLGVAAPAIAATYLTRPQALAEAFPGARIERRPFALTPDQARVVERRAQVKLPSRLVTAYPAWRGDSLAGTAFFESRLVRTMPGVFMVVVAPDTTIARIEVLAFHEPPDYRPPARWLGGFARRRLPAAGAPASGAPASGTPASGTPASGTPASGTPASGTPASGTKDRLWPGRDLRNLAGATLSARSVTESARLALALYETVVVPTLAGPRPGPEAR